MPFFIIFLLFIQIVSARDQDSSELSKEEKEKYTSAAINIIQREEAYLKESKCWTMTNLPTVFYTNKIYNVKGQQKIGVIQSAEPSSFSIEFLPDNTQIVSFMNLTSLHAGNHYYSDPPKLKWTSEKAVSLATGYAKAVLGSQMPNNLPAPYVYPHKEMDYPRYMDSEWMVIWPRVDKEGHRFHRDSLVVILTDGHGPNSLGYNFWSRYDDKHITPIAQEKALALAAEGAKEILGWGPGALWLKDYELVNPPKMDLEIVDPNHLPNQSSIEALGHGFDLNARLAWVVLYQKIYKGPPSSDNLKPTNGDIQVWIDAENGQLLGGDFK